MEGDRSALWYFEYQHPDGAKERWEYRPAVSKEGHYADIPKQLIPRSLADLGRLPKKETFELKIELPPAVTEAFSKMRQACESMKMQVENLRQDPDLRALVDVTTKAVDDELSTAFGMHRKIDWSAFGRTIPVPEQFRKFAQAAQEFQKKVAHTAFTVFGVSPVELENKAIEKLIVEYIDGRIDYIAVQRELDLLETKAAMRIRSSISSHSDNARTNFGIDPASDGADAMAYALYSRKPENHMNQNEVQTPETDIFDITGADYEAVELGCRQVLILLEMADGERELVRNLHGSSSSQIKLVLSPAQRLELLSMSVKNIHTRAGQVLKELEKVSTALAKRNGEDTTDVPKKAVSSRKSRK